MGWIPAGAAVGFGAAFLFGDLFPLPVDLYYLIYFCTVAGFLILYAWRTGLDVSTWTRRRLAWGFALGALGGAVLLQGVLAQPATPRLSGGELARDLLWRGLVYGTVDGLLLLAFPWVVTWRALGAEEGPWSRKVGAGLVAWGAVLLVTTAYRDFRSEKILQPALGSTIGAVPTLLSANPVASPLSHVFLHLAAVLHAPKTSLFLPPHREPATETAAPP